MMFLKPRTKGNSDRPSSTLKYPYLKALRPRQWTKNLIVFAAPLFGFSLTLQTVLGSILAFVLFCGLSSSFYLLNDVLDVEADRRHPVKCHRPIAAGLVPVPVAILLAIGLLGGSLGIAWNTDLGLGTSLSCYAMLQIAYNLKLKRVVILDIIAIGSGFVLRAYAGAAATNIILSPWFLLCTGLLALFLGIEKRKAELRLRQVANGETVKRGSTRTVLQQYSLPLLDRMESTVTTGAVLTYAVWSSGPQVNGATTPWMLITVPFVLYGVFRYQWLSDPQRAILLQSERGRTERPEEILLTDLPTLLTIATWVTATLLILTLKHQGMIQ